MTGTDESAAAAAAAESTGVAETDAKLGGHEAVDDWVHTTVNVWQEIYNELRTKKNIPRQYLQFANLYTAISSSSSSSSYLFE